MVWQDIQMLVHISDELIEEKGKDELLRLGEQYYYEEVLRRYNRIKSNHDMPAGSEV